MHNRFLSYFADQRWETIFFTLMSYIFHLCGSLWVKTSVCGVQISDLVGQPNLKRRLLLSPTCNSNSAILLTMFVKCYVCWSTSTFSGGSFISFFFPVFFLNFWFPVLLCFSASLLFCFSASSLLCCCFSAFCFFAFLLLCFSAFASLFLLFCFSLLLCLSALLRFPAFLVLCFFASLLPCFFDFLLFPALLRFPAYFWFFASLLFRFSILSCVFLLFCFFASLFPCFFVFCFSVFPYFSAFPASVLICFSAFLLLINQWLFFSPTLDRS